MTQYTNARIEEKKSKAQKKTKQNKRDVGKGKEN